MKGLGAYAENHDAEIEARYHEPDREEFGRPVRLLAELEAERAISKLLAEALGWSHDGTVCKGPECHANAALAKYREGL